MRSRAIQAGVLAALLAGCAQVEPPSGGPEIVDPPEVVAVRPDSLAVVRDLRAPAVFVFDTRISEQGVEEAVTVSPRTSTVVVDHGRSEIRVGLRRGWESGRIYHVTLLPEIRDLWNNRMESPVHLVFSTGPAIPDTHLDGMVTDRVTGRAEVGARVEAIRTADSLVYATRTDSAGAYAMSRVPTGEYRVRAYPDANLNRALDPFEPRDSAVVALQEGDRASVDLWLVLPDTTPPEAASAHLENGRVTVTFNDHLDPGQDLSAVRVRVTGPAGEAVETGRIAVGVLPAAPAANPEAGDPPAEPAEAREPLPSRDLVIEISGELRPGAEYRVTVEDVLNLTGIPGGGEVPFTTPEAAPEATDGSARQP